MSVKIFHSSSIFITDINECEDGIHPCSHHCYNTIGSYTCDCTTGFELDEDSQTCIG